MLLGKWCRKSTNVRTKSRSLEPKTEKKDDRALKAPYFLYLLTQK
jgi:hypothetical protein